MNYFILVASPVYSFKYGFVGALDSAMVNLKAKKWPMNVSTKNKKNIMEGDKLLIYLAGTIGPSKVFVASASAASGLRHMTFEFPKDWDRIPTEYGILLRGVVIHNKYVQVKKILNELVFIKNEIRWGSHLQGGCIKISKEDFETICDNFK